MTVTSGFFDSVTGDRLYNSEQMSRIFEGIVTSGIFQSIGGALVVSTSSGMTVSVAAGRAWFNYTWTLNDTALLLTLDASEIALNRIDRIILEVNKTTAVRANTIKVLKGTPASSPVAPTLSNTATLIQYSLADIYVAAGVTSITAPNITNKVGSVGTPFITGILESVDIATLLVRYESEFNVWMDGLEDQLDDNQAGNLQNQINAINAALVGVAIEGFKLVWNSGSGISVDVGSCYTQSGNQIRTTSILVKSALSLSGSTWYHVYIYLNTGIPTVEVVTTVPAPWKGNAYSKTGDTSRRYLGSIKTDAGGSIFEFRHNLHMDSIIYSGTTAVGVAPHRALTAGTATTATEVNLSSVIPSWTASQGFLRLFNLSDKVISFGDTTAVLGPALNAGNTSAQNAFLTVPLTTTPGYYYKAASTIGAGGAYIDVYGYYFRR
jgi:hypothetical protein